MSAGVRAHWPARVASADLAVMSWPMRNPRLPLVTRRYPVWIVESAVAFYLRYCHRCHCPTSLNRASDPSAACDSHGAAVVAVVGAVAVAVVAAAASGGDVAAVGAEDSGLLDDLH